MKKGLIITALSLMLGLGLSSCGGGNKAKLIGTWVEPAAENSAYAETGFTLEKGGTVVPINMGYMQYETWKKVGDLLIFRGKYTGTNPHPLADTMWIDELTEEQLVLKDFWNYSVTYQRKTE